MNLRQLEVFVAVIETGSFSRGAQATSLTQPTVSQHIAALEDEAGLRLLDRGGRGVLPTQAGKLYLRHAHRVLAECSALRAALAEFNGLQQANLTLGASNIPANYLMPRVLPQLASAYPGIHLNMQTGDSQAMLERLHANEFELAVVGSRNNERALAFESLATDLLILVVSPLHPWSQVKILPLDALRQGPMILREQGSGTGKALNESLREAGFDPAQLQVAGQLGSNEAVRQTLLGGFGAAFLSEISVRQELLRGELISIRVENLHVQRQLWLATRSRRELSPAAQVIVALLKKHCANP
ncbi:MAG: LysR family transcriptional regulator [Deltaproteobacteria bacterium]|nr:LysR family transcriptional regulator [Deltaproteobacteria bacterium]